ncbi:MAG: nucleotide pyrophosphatase [Planctomycetes bacterium]|nr:nucleotide pyrophosphatase [Planctomycetota bacterium]MDP6408484.1 alkaline phosphatase family protein [Planctomycetota bacterium]
MRQRHGILRAILAAALLLVGLQQPALAYIGPGAGFAAAGAAYALLGTFLLVFIILLLWPVKAVYRIATSFRFPKPKVKRVVVLGLDGFDPGLAKRFMDEGRMPNLKQLAEQGCFHPLATACPSISPVAWSSFATGVDASRHNIYDFLTRDPCNYLPVLSSSETGTLPRTLNLGFAELPFGKKAFFRLLQKSQPFWKLLGANRVWSSIIRVPITFPPQKFKNGTLLSGMCVPDIQGTQGSFAFYSTRSRPTDAHIGGQQYQVTRRGNRVESKLTGPAGADGHPMKASFSVEFDDQARRARITVGGETVEVGPREYTPWLRIPFDGVNGIARAYIQTWDEDDVEIYFTPINIDPDSPAMPISHPFVYAIYLAKLFGPYATLGLAEDTWALNERVIDEEAFLKQAWLIFEERKKQLWDALEKTKKGFVTVVFDTTDRISHMFYRYLDPEHPANHGKDTERHADVIPAMYARMDEFVAEVREKVDRVEDTVFMVISDHGFTNFRRGVNLNSWLRDEGYLVLNEGCETSGDYFRDVDWTKTRAFTIGLTGIFINRIGREAEGIVAAEELGGLCRELKEKLEALRDPLDGQPVIKEAFVTEEIHSGPYRDMAPELLIGYHKGFRHSWDCATGSASKAVFSDNTKSWSGDHCVDPRLVPGVFWCNRPIDKADPELLDLAPTVLDLFGVEIPAYMQGSPLFGGASATAGRPAQEEASEPTRAGAAPREPEEAR